MNSRTNVRIKNSKTGRKAIKNKRYENLLQLENREGHDLPC